MVYQYVAYNDNGEIVKGKLSATNEEVATEQLNYAGYQAITLKPFTPLISLNKLVASLSPAKPAEIIFFYRQLAMLLESGIDITACLELLQGQASNRTLRKALGDVISDLRSGNQLSAALSKHPQVFPPVYCRLMGVGEQGGNLELVLKQIADYMEKEVDTVKHVKSALMYPIITSIVTLAVIGVLAVFVLPTFGSLYHSLGIDLPPLVGILIAATDKIQDYGLYIALAALILAGLALIYIKTPNGRYKWDRFILSLPLVGRIRHISELARYCRSMSLLFSSGLPINEAISLIVEGSGNRAMAKALADVQQDMVKGEGLSRPMVKNRLFLPMMVQMVKVGEETGNLDVTLLAVARSYEAEAEDKTRALVALIQPAMTIIMGLIIGLITLSLTSAIYAMYGQGF
jgi:type IV pilus assembly protein PilC